MSNTDPTSRRQFLQHSSALAVASLFTGAGLPALAQANWPSRPIRLIAGYPAASSPDMQARLIAEPLSKLLGQSVVVENKPGAGGNIGTDQIAKAKDGHTIGIVGNGPLTSAKFLYPKLPYDPQKDLVPLALIAASPLVLVAPAAAVKGTAADYIKYAREQGDKLNYASPGSGSGGHLGVELLKERFDLKAVHVPFAGAPAILNAMLGGQIDLALLPPSTVAPHIESGKIKAVLVSSAQRTPLVPNVAALSEIGAAELNIEVWNAIMGPASLTAPQLTRLRDDLGKVLAAADIKENLRKQGWAVGDTSATGLAQRIKSDSKLYGDLIVKKGIKID